MDRAPLEKLHRSIQSCAKRFPPICCHSILPGHSQNVSEPFLLNSAQTNTSFSLRFGEIFPVISLKSKCIEIRSGYLKLAEFLGDVEGAVVLPAPHPADAPSSSDVSGMREGVVVVVLGRS